MATVVPTSRPRHRSVTYRLVPAETLPSVEVRRTVRLAVLGETWSRRHAAFMKRHTAVSIACYFVGLGYRFYGMLFPPRYSLGWWLVLASLLQAPSVTAVALSLRIDIIRQLAKSFEFWFLSAINIVWALSMGVGYNDARVSACLLNVLETENAKLTDANLQGLHLVVVTAAMAIAMLVSFLIGVMFQLIELERVVLCVTPRGHAVLVQDVLLNVMATMLLFMARLAYRRRDAVRRTQSTRATLCVTCRCRLKFEMCDVATENPASVRRSSREAWRTPPATPALKPRALSLGTIQLECIAIDERFDATNVLVRGVPSFPKWLRMAWFVVAGVAFAALAWLCLMTPPTSTSSAIHNDSTTVWIALLTLACTVIAVVPFLMHHQRQLLRRLCGSFDFVFLMAQLMSALLCVCHLTQWAPQTCVVTVCVWIWFYVVVTTDALTPDAKRLLHWRPRHAAWLALALLAATLVLVLDLTVWGAWRITDRVLVDWNVFGTRVQISGLPFLLGRIAIIVIWNCRLLWRLASCGDDELIMLVGAVQYENVRALSRRNASAAGQLTTIVPLNGRAEQAS